FGQYVTFGERGTRLEPKRAQHAVVAVVALQHDADERCRWRATARPELLRDLFASRWIELFERSARKPCEIIERSRALLGVAAERWQDVGLDAGIVGAGHAVFGAFRDDHRRDRAKVVALGGGKNFSGHRVLNRTNWPGAASSDRRHRARWPG